MDEVHDEPDDFQWAGKRGGSRIVGCPCCHGKPQPASERTDLIGVLADLMGDDLDGLAAELEDAEWLGLLD